MLSSSKLDFNGLHLFILLMHIAISYQVQVIHTYISYCFIFEVSDSLSTNCATIATFWCLDTQLL